MTHELLMERALAKLSQAMDPSDAAEIFMPGADAALIIRAAALIQDLCGKIEALESRLQEPSDI